MIPFLIYVLKSAACLTAFYLLYKLLLGRDTLHRMNRVLLTGVLVLSLVLPLCVITVTRELPPPSVPELPLDLLPVAGGEITPVALPATPAPVEVPFDWMKLLAVLYITGVTAVLARTAVSVGRVVRMIRGGRKRLLEDGKTLVLTQKHVPPFSWMKYVVMSEADWAQNGQTILLHEQTHLRLGHSWDLLAIDLLGSLQWFNPAMWLLGRELRAVHEYEADEEVLRAGINAKDYQLLLIKKAVGQRWYSIANSLNHSNLKNRITMMSQKRSSRWARAKALYVLPIVCLSLGAFARTVYTMPDPLPDKGNELFGGKTQVAHTDIGVSGWKGAMEISHYKDFPAIIHVAAKGEGDPFMGALKLLEDHLPKERTSGQARALELLSWASPSRVDALLPDTRDFHRPMITFDGKEVQATELEGLLKAAVGRKMWIEVFGDTAHMSDVELFGDVSGGLIRVETMDDSIAPEDFLADLMATLAENAGKYENEGEHTLYGRVVDANGRPIAGYPFYRDDKNTLKTDHDGRFEFRDKAVGFHFVDDGEGGNSGGFDLWQDMDVTIKLTGHSIIFITEPRAKYYLVRGTAADYRFDRDHLPLIVGSHGFELSPEWLQRILTQQKNTILFAKMDKGSHWVERYGERAANGVLHIDIMAPRKESWGSAKGQPYRDMRIYLLGKGEELPKALSASSKKVEEEATPSPMASLSSVFSGKEALVDAIQLKGVSGYVDPQNGHVRMTVDSLVYTTREQGGEHKFYVQNATLAESSDPGMHYLLVVDGEPSDAAHVNAIPKDCIALINVTKGGSKMEQYGERAKDGVIEVTTNKRELAVSFMHGNFYYDRRSGTTRIKDTGNGFAIRPDEGMRPLVLVDGVPTDISFLDPIDADAVEFVQVIQPGVEIWKTYSGAARDGVIRIVTKKGAKQLSKRRLKLEFPQGNVRRFDLVGGMYAIKEAKNGLSVRINDGMQPLVLVGDQRKELSYLNSIDADADSIHMIFVSQPDSKVLRSPSWFRMYGSETRDGMIYFQTKKDMRQMAESMQADLQRRIEAASDED